MDVAEPSLVLAMTEASASLQDASMTHGATDHARATRAVLGALDRVAVLLTLMGVAGVLIVARIGLPGVLNPGTGANTFFVQYRRHEPIFLALMAVFGIAAALSARRALPESGADASVWPSANGWGPGRIAAVGLGVFAIAAVGAWNVMHAFPMAMDEYVAGFQAHIFAAGRVTVPLPDEWKQLGMALKPVFVVYDPDKQVWLSAYWPVYGIVRALFLLAGPRMDLLLNPLLAAASVPLVYLCARRLWPNDKPRAWLAVAFLVLSSQFLFMSMTSYAMPAHLVHRSAVALRVLA